MRNNQWIMNLSDVGLSDIAIVGGKNASLGEMLQNLGKYDVKVPSGFIITVAAYEDFIHYNQLQQKIDNIITETDVDDIVQLQRCGREIRQLISSAVFPDALDTQITAAYQDLSNLYNQENVDVAVRSSATAEDLPDASFAGQQDTYLNISGKESILLATRNCFASLFTDRAISYRKSFGFDSFQIGISVCIQKMVRSDVGASGVAFSIDTESGFKDVVVINGAFGLGETVVQGMVSPDEFAVFKPLLKQGFNAIVDRKLGRKDKKMIYADNSIDRVKIVPTSENELSGFCLTEKNVLQLAKWICDIEDHYSRIKGHWCPMDVEWALDGISNELFIVQARPETIHSRRLDTKIVTYDISDVRRQERIIVKGIAVGDNIAQGRVHLIADKHKEEMHKLNFLPGDILVTDMTDPDWEPLMKKAAAIVTNKGGRTCHAAIVARELGIPAIVGCINATELLSDGDIVTASCAEGDVGFIYTGAVAYTKTEHDLLELSETETPIMLNVASPDMAYRLAGYPNSGVGLAREEFIINNYIKVHPMALLKYKVLQDEKLTSDIEKIIYGYPDGESYFVHKLSYGISRIASAFYPKKVIVRFSDFKTNEYHNLLGGSRFEPNEENPMIGWRGASRYYSDQYKEAFAMECKAINKVRNEIGLNNVVVMIPFCRTVTELLKVYDVMKTNGLERGKDGLEVYLMAEIPSNIIMADEFCDHIDGFSIGSNDLTQLVLGLDRDSALVSYLYNERDAAVKRAITTLISTAKAKGVKVGICGQGPSDYPDFARFLVEEGIDTISVTPDAFFKTNLVIQQAEQQLKHIS
ncbi:phosphoenolpyruvate synthase [Pedobacter rhizosphaerae]|nr:phosphoenolpyruvate synthase [Pedobacter rhizosphaerae]